MAGMRRVWRRIDHLHSGRQGGQAGDHRMETQVTTGERTNPIVELESTTVY